MQSTSYSCQILIKFEFSLQIFENKSNIKLYQISPVKAEFFHVDGRTERRTDKLIDMTKLSVAFRNSTNAPKKEYILPIITGVKLLLVFHGSFFSRIILTVKRPASATYYTRASWEFRKQNNSVMESAFEFPTAYESWKYLKKTSLKSEKYIYENLVNFFNSRLKEQNNLV